MLSSVVTALVIGVIFLVMVRVSIGLDTDNKRSAIAAALIIGIVNGALRPILESTAFPLNYLTFALAAIVLNGIFLYLTAAILRGFYVRGCVNGLIAGVFLGLLNTTMYGLFLWLGS